MSFWFCTQLVWHPPCGNIIELQNIMDSMMCWTMTHPNIYFIYYYYAHIISHHEFYCSMASSFLLSGGDFSVTELMLVWNFLVYLYDCWIDRLASTHSTFIISRFAIGLILFTTRKITILLIFGVYCHWGPNFYITTLPFEAFQLGAFTFLKLLKPCKSLSKF